MFKLSIRLFEEQQVLEEYSTEEQFYDNIDQRLFSFLTWLREVKKAIQYNVLEETLRIVQNLPR